MPVNCCLYMMPLYQAVITPADNQASKTHIITLKTNILRLLIPSVERAAELVRHSRELFHHSISGFIHTGSPASEPGQHIGLCCERFVAERIRVDIKLLADSIWDRQVTQIGLSDAELRCCLRDISCGYFLARLSNENLRRSQCQQGKRRTYKRSQIHSIWKMVICYGALYQFPPLSSSVKVFMFHICWSVWYHLTLIVKSAIGGGHISRNTGR